MRKLITFLGLMCLVAMMPGDIAFADDVDCAKAVTTADLNACANKDFEAADKALNETYKKILADLALPDTENAANNMRWTEALKASQRAWIAFRDADCQKLVPFEAGGGSATTGEVIGCQTSLTEARTKSLKDRYEQR